MTTGADFAAAATVMGRGDNWGPQQLWTVELGDASFDVYADDEDGARAAAAAAYDARQDAMQT